jgi:ribulose-phosphate 3-epimerase
MSGMGHDLFKRPARLPLVLPSILSADFAKLGEEVADVIDQGADGIHVDVMDGHFVPNLTMGPALVRSLRKRFADVYLDVHLMVEQPEKFVRPFADVGADCLTFHIELFEPAGGERSIEEANDLIDQIHAADCAAGVAINPPTEGNTIDAILQDIDLVLVMSVNPGFSGQKFIADVLAKTRAIKPRLRDDQRLEMDGGINGDTVAQVRAAGCDTIVAASYLFGAADRAEAINVLRGQ